MSATVCFEAADSVDAHRLIEALSAVLAGITGNDGKSSFDVADMTGSGARFAIARDERGDAIGCGGLRPLADGVAEIKRMYAAPGTRGVGTALLAFLEAEAAAMGYKELWLSTRQVNAGAVAFYAARGFRRIPNFGKYVGSAVSVCFAKTVGGHCDSTERARG